MKSDEDVKVRFCFNVLTQKKGEITKQGGNMWIAWFRSDYVIEVCNTLGLTNSIPQVLLIDGQKNELRI